MIPYLFARARFRKAYEYDLYPESTKTYKPFASGIEVIDEHGSVFIRSASIKTAGKAGNYIYLILIDGNYYILPKLSFSSDAEAAHFVRVVKSGIANEKGLPSTPSLTFKPGYFVGLLCLIPLIGAFAGFVLIILGLVHYKDKVFVIMGAIGIIITVALYGSMFYSMQHSSFAKDGFAQITQTQINDLVKNIEFYKLQNGAYPDSLQQLDTKDSFVSIYDTMNDLDMSNKKATPYHYQKKGNKYLLFSVGVDGKPDTRDDIYPTLGGADTSKLGFIRK